MKKVISQISLILLIITIGILSVFATNIYAADSIAGINCPASVKVGENFTVSLILPSNAYGADAKVTITYSDGTTASKTLTYMSGMADFPNSVTFSAKVAGTAQISVTSINIGDSAGGYIEQGGSKNGSLTIVGDTTSNNSGTGNGSDSNTGSGSSSGSNTGSGSNSSTGTGTGTGTNSGTNTGSNTGTGSTSGNTTTSKEPKFTDVNETVYTTQKCNVRKSYSTDSEKITTLEKDTKLTRKAIGDNGWSKVEYNGQTAYVYSEYLTKTEPEEVVFKDTHENLYAKQDCNLRASWSTDSEKVGYLTKGQAVERTGYADNGWSRILYNGKTVYVASRLLVVEKPEEDEEENTVANNTVNNIVNNSVKNENLVDDPTQMSEEDRLKELEEEVGVLPEVGTNVANIVYVVVTFIAIAGVIASIIYVKKVR